MKNKEIEELLDKLKDKDWYEELDLTGTKWIELKQEETNLLLSYIEQLQTTANECKQDYQRMKDNFDSKVDVIATLSEEKKQLENNRDKAIEVINTQLKNAEGGLKDNLRIIKFNLIKGSCTFEDLKTEEDYKYVLKGDSDYE